MNGDFVAVSVVDRGSGIDSQEQRLIFNEGYRGKDQRNVVQGTGMGLPIAKTIVEAHGGSLGVASKRGSGCVFSFTLPSSPRTIPCAAVFAKTPETGDTGHQNGALSGRLKKFVH